MADIIVNDSDAGVTFGGAGATWTPAAAANQWDGDEQYSLDVTATATYPFAGLTSGVTYTLFSYWFAAGNRTTDAIYLVKGHAGATLATFNVDQTVTPTGPINLTDTQPVAFNCLTIGTFVADGTTGSVVMTSGTGDGSTMVADMIGMRPHATANIVLEFLILKLLGGKTSMPLPVALGGTFRIGVHNDSLFDLPANVITARLAGLSNLLAFISPVALIAASDGSGASAGITAGTWAYSGTIDNTTANAIGGDVSLIVDLTGSKGSGSGALRFLLQNSCDGGTTWPDPGVGIAVGSASCVIGKKTVTAVKV